MRIERTNIDLNWAVFDAVLDTEGVDAHTNARLTITLKVFLRQNAGAPRRMILPQMTSRIRRGTEGSARDTDGNQFVFDRFTPEQWNHFTSFYQSVGQEFWDGNFWLGVPDSFDTSAWGSGLEDRPVGFGHASTLAPYRVVRPNIDCHFRLELVDNSAHAHKTIDVYNIVSGLTPEPTVPGATRGFRADDEHYDLTSIERVEHSGTDVQTGQLLQTFQRTFLHEIGHAIGLEHVGVNMRIVGCFDADDHNITICYGNNLASRDNIMGGGESFSWHEALPWRRAMEVLTGVSRHSWEVHQTFFGPQVVLHTA